MKRLIGLLFIITLSGCSVLPEEEGTDVEQATTVIDAIEGDKSEEAPSNMVDVLRSRTDPVAGDPAWAPIHPTQKASHYAAATGSLFSTAHANNLYDDSKPHGIGDIVTVLLEEQTKAAKSADAGLTKSNDSSMEPLEVGGNVLKVGGEYNFSYALSNSNNFSGNSSANQSNSMSGSISVEVIDVLANGNLVIRGEKWLMLNTGEEYIRLSGTIRPDDISYENTIESTRISNARIQYSGTGTQRDMQEPGFLARFFNVSL